MSDEQASRRTTEWSAEELSAYLDRTFDESERDDARALIASYGVESYEREVLRVRRAVLQGARGDIGRLRMLVRMAKNDYRDVLMRDEGP